MEDRSFLAKQLTSKSGRAFSRHIAKFQLGYDQLDRLSHMPQGRSTIERLVRGPDGWKLLEYMAKAPGGHELGRMLSETPKGGNFEKATGRIYTEMELVGGSTNYIRPRPQGRPRNRRDKSTACYRTTPTEFNTTVCTGSLSKPFTEAVRTCEIFSRTSSP